MLLFVLMRLRKLDAPMLGSRVTSNTSAKTLIKMVHTLHVVEMLIIIRCHYIPGPTAKFSFQILFGPLFLLISLFVIVYSQRRTIAWYEKYNISLAAQQSSIYRSSMRIQRTFLSTHLLFHLMSVIFCMLKLAFSINFPPDLLIPHDQFS